MMSFLGSALTDGHEEEILFVTCSSDEVNVADSDSQRTPDLDISDENGATLQESTEGENFEESLICIQVHS